VYKQGQKEPARREGKSGRMPVWSLASCHTHDTEHCAGRKSKRKKKHAKRSQKTRWCGGHYWILSAQKKRKIKKMSIEAAKMSRRNYCINIRALALLSPHPTHFFFFFSVLRVFDRDVNQKQ
jgi:hypothetical protein